jgi:acetoacetyl-CoA synthetase
LYTRQVIEEMHQNPGEAEMTVDPSNPLWTPSAERKAGAVMTRFMAHVAKATGRKFDDYLQLHAYSTAEPGPFWSHVWDFAGVVGEKGAAPFVEDGDRLPGARFFPRASLNIAENVLAGLDDRSEIVFWGEDVVKRRVGAKEIRAETGKVAAILREAGIKAGDRVAAILPNMPEAITSMLGAASLGAVWSSCSPDFGVQGILDRFGQIEPRVLIAVDGYYYAGKRIELADKLTDVLAKLPSVELVIVVSYVGSAAAVVSKLGAGRRAATFDLAVRTRTETEPEFNRLPFAHPLFILYSSGTTGVPKCIVHSAGGTLMKHLTEHQMHSDIAGGDRVFYFTTLGWMMWNWLATTLASGASAMLYDGSPFHPNGNILWDYAQAERFTLFGTSAKYIDALKKAGLDPARSHDLSALKSVLSTGSPLSPESFAYVYDAIKRDVHLASISGGTDIVGCFVLGNPLLPVWTGEIQSAGLGVAIDVADDDGKPMPQGKGELVCRQPFPSMPVGFWNDPDGAKYRSAYFSRFPNTWHHGDFAEWTSHRGMIIHGRSDATLNPGGVRIGTAEIYRQVELLPEVQESIVIGQDWDNDIRVVLFVVMKAGHALDDALRERIKKQIRQGASPRHVPARIVQIADIPRTKSGKITELAVREVVMGRAVKNKEALANPEALDLFRDLPELSR